MREPFHDRYLRSPLSAPASNKGIERSDQQRGENRLSYVRVRSGNEMSGHREAETARADEYSARASTIAATRSERFCWECFGEGQSKSRRPVGTGGRPDCADTDSPGSQICGEMDRHSIQTKNHGNDLRINRRNLKTVAAQSAAQNSLSSTRRERSALASAAEPFRRRPAPRNMAASRC